MLDAAVLAFPGQYIGITLKDHYIDKVESLDITSHSINIRFIRLE